MLHGLGLAHLGTISHVGHAVFLLGKLRRHADIGCGHGELAVRNGNIRAGSILHAERHKVVAGLRLSRNGHNIAGIGLAVVSADRAAGEVGRADHIILRVRSRGRKRNRCVLHRHAGNGDLPGAVAGHGNSGIRRDGNAGNIVFREHIAPVRGVNHRGHGHAQIRLGGCAGAFGLGHILRCCDSHAESRLAHNRFKRTCIVDIAAGFGGGRRILHRAILHLDNKHQVIRVAMAVILRPQIDIIGSVGTQRNGGFRKAETHRIVHTARTNRHLVGVGNDTEVAVVRQNFVKIVVGGPVATIVAEIAPIARVAGALEPLGHQRQTSCHTALNPVEFGRKAFQGAAAVISGVGHLEISHRRARGCKGRRRKQRNRHQHHQKQAHQFFHYSLPLILKGIFLLAYCTKSSPGISFAGAKCSFQGANGTLFH